MSGITAKSSGGANFEPAPAGNHVAICYSMIYLGTQKEEYQGTEKSQEKVRLTWELTEETKEFKEGEGEKPWSVSQEYTLSLGERANLRKHLESWRGKEFTKDELQGFDITNVLGVPCMLNVMHRTSKTGNKYVQVTGVTPLPKSMPKPKMFNEKFTITPDDFKNEPLLMTLPDWIKEKIYNSEEYKANTGHAEAQVNSNDETDDDLPF